MWKAKKKACQSTLWQLSSRTPGSPGRACFRLDTCPFGMLLSVCSRSLMTWSEIKKFLLSYNTIVCIVATFVGREVVWRKYLQLLILRNDCRVEHIRSDSVASPQNGTVLVWDKTEEATQIMNLWWKLIKSHHSVKNAHKVDIAAAILTAWDQAPQFGK